MKINGIIAEYNPFHNGHLYHLEESRRLTGADYTVVVMSGNFVQRGAPALADKHVRARMALLGGADLVLELPVLYAAASSEYFAAGAVALLDKLGAVTHLCFGSECGDTALLRQIAAFLAREPEEYREELKRLLKQGLSFPTARAGALAARSGWEDRGRCEKAQNGCGDAQNCREEDRSAGKGLPSFRLPRSEECRRILSSPNNILGIDYMKEMIRRKSAMIPVTVKRVGAGYHDELPPDASLPTSLPESMPLKSPEPALSSSLQDSSARENPKSARPSALHAYAEPLAAQPAGFPGAAGISAPGMTASALAIRQALREGRTPDSLRPFMPDDTVELLADCLARDASPDPGAFSGILYYKLLLEKNRGYEQYLDVSEDLSNRIRNNLHAFTDFGSFCSLLKTKEITHTRISRCLLHILLDIKKEDMQLGRALDYVPYARVLGFRRTAEPLLNAVKSNSAVPFITRMADVKRSLPEEADRLLKLDIFAGEIYRGVICGGRMRPTLAEFSIPVIVL